MVYKVFISTTNDAHSQEYTSTVKRALWQLDEFPVSPTTMADLVQSDAPPQQIVRGIIDEANIFIGIYGSTFGDYEGLNVADLIEFEYSYAVERGVTTLIYMPSDYDTTDERLADFKQRVKQRQVVQMFNSLEDLQAKVVIGVTNYRQNMRNRPPMPPPRTGLVRERITEIEHTPSDTQFEVDVKRALDVVEDDIERIVRRSLALQNAQNNLVQPTVKGTQHEITVNPIFGEPNNNVQFQSDIFMIMPFREQFDVVYQNVIRPVVSDMNLTIKRGDDFSSVRGQIISEVWAAIHACRLVIVETSVENANVYYELGIAHTLGKPAILITQGKNIEDFPFDIRHLRFIVYENTIQGGEKLEADLRKSIIWIMNDLEDGE